MKRNQRDSLARSAMKLLCTLLGLILAVMVGFTAIFQYIMGRLNYTQLPSRDPEGVVAVFSEGIASLSSSSGNKTIGGVGSGLINILLVGQDRREGETQARADSMILCTFHKESGQLTMTSFLRDLYVPIPGHHDNRINASYSIGGMDLLRQTLEENFDLHIDGCVEVDFSQFSEIVDRLGGVEIELRQDEAEVINRETGSALSSGVQRLNGSQALTYSRIRSLDADGDFSRTNRQRKVITALLGSYRNVRFSELIPTINTLLPMISTDLNQAQILLYALEVLPALSDAQITSQRVPADGTYTDQTIDGMSVLVADMDTARQLLRESLQKS